MQDEKQPVVSIILTAYNQEKYVGAALESVRSQTYPAIQLIVIDNASTDGTLSVITHFKETLPALLLIENTTNIGLCRAFNQGLAMAQGKYVIDLSGDDVMLPERLAKQVKSFESLADDYAVVFTNAIYMEADGREKKTHYAVDANGKSLQKVPSGDVYKNILEKYFICTPTMMMRTSTLRLLGGYDETLRFEDFDFWVRSSARFRYFYLDEILTGKRRISGSLSAQVYQKGSGMLFSYYQVCNKAYDLNRDQQEFNLLAARIRTFIRKCFYAQEFELAEQFCKLLNYIENPGWQTRLMMFLCRLHIPVNFLYRFYLENLKKV